MVVHENEWYWLAGLIEAEGSFAKPPASEPRRFRLNIEMTGADVLQRAGALTGNNYLQKRKARYEHWTDTYKLQIRGEKAIKIMMTVFPLMGERRKKQIQSILDISDWNTAPFIVLSIPQAVTGAELYWLAGLLEGDGTFVTATESSRNRPMIRLWMTDEDIVARVATIWNLKYQEVERDNGWKTAYVVSLRGKRAVELMQKLRPLMGERRQAQIDRVLNKYDPDREQKARIKGNITKAALEPDQVREIRRRLKNGERHSAIAASYGVKSNVIACISCGKTWVWLDAEEKDNR